MEARHSSYENFIEFPPVPMKIALCKSILAGPVSGADEALVNYAKHLHLKGHAVTVVLLHPPRPNDSYRERLRRAGVAVLCINETSRLNRALLAARDLVFGLLLIFYLPASFRRARRIWQALYRVLSRLYERRCRKFFGRLRPDLLHVFTPDAGAVMMIRTGHQLGIPVLYHEMGTPRPMPALDIYYRELEKVLPLCDEFAALSPCLAQQWAERFPFLTSISVLPFIIQDCNERSSETPRAATHETIFGYAARLEEGKGPLLLVEALKHLISAGVPAIVKMAGTGPQLPEVMSRVRELGLDDVCKLVGYYTEPNGRDAFMRSLDVFVLPSLAEGTPNSVIEAMAHGLPVIATAVGGIPDLLSPDSGILIPHGNAAALELAMRRLASDPALRASMGLAARERYLKQFSPEPVLRTLLNTYRRVAGARTLRERADERADNRHAPVLVEESSAVTARTSVS
jgi:glycosyltransferase involved in cell wall biosynthesis